MVGKVQFVLRETGNLFAISLEGLRRTPDVRTWWKEYLRQCWFLAKVTSIPVVLVLVSLVSVSGIAGGYFFNVVIQKVTPGAYFQGFTSLVQLPDLCSSLAKAWVFGFIAAMVACYKGIYAKGGPKGVGDAVNQAVVITFILIFFATFVMTSLYFALVPQKF